MFYTYHAAVPRLDIGVVRHNIQAVGCDASAYSTPCSMNDVGDFPGHNDIAYIKSQCLSPEAKVS